MNIQPISVNTNFKSKQHFGNVIKNPTLNHLQQKAKCTNSFSIFDGIISIIKDLINGIKDGFSPEHYPKISDGKSAMQKDAQSLVNDLRNIGIDMRTAIKKFDEEIKQTKK